MGSEKQVEVLVVDDEATVRNFLSLFLTSNGYAVRKASDGVEAMEAMAQRVPDLVLLDVMMPRLDGHGVLRAMKADPVLSRVPVLVVSAAGDIGSELEGCAVLRKPVSTASLLDQLARCLAPDYGRGAQ